MIISPYSLLNIDIAEVCRASSGGSVRVRNQEIRFVPYSPARLIYEATLLY